MAKIMLSKLILMMETFPEQMVEITDTDHIDHRTHINLAFNSDKVPYIVMSRKLHLLEEPPEPKQK